LSGEWEVGVGDEDIAGGQLEDCWRTAGGSWKKEDSWRKLEGGSRKLGSWKEEGGRRK
jgi:hypothetical protein